MKYLLLIAATALPASVCDAMLIAGEDFDSATTWSNNVASSTFVDPSSSDQGLFIQAGSSLGPDNVLFGRDLQNESGEPDLNPVNLSFDSVDISAFTDVVVSFDYDLDGFDSTDSIDYTLTFTGGSDTGTFGGNDAGTYMFAIPDTATSVELSLVLDQNGASDSFELDNFAINGVVAIPEPTAALFGSLIAGALGLTIARRPQSRD